MKRSSPWRILRFESNGSELNQALPYILKCGTIGNLASVGIRQDKPELARRIPKFKQELEEKRNQLEMHVQSAISSYRQDALPAGVTSS